MKYRAVLLWALIFLCRNASLPCAAESAVEVPQKSVYSSHLNDENKIALTFDDGPHPVYTPQILDILKQYGVHATFFMIGENAQRYPELVLRIMREGHEIGNHTYYHANLQKTKPEKIREEILDAENVILQIGDLRPKLLRPPGGLYDQRVCEAARALDYDIILWTVDTLDWAHTPPEEIVDKVKNNIQCGDIILCHDFVGGKPSPTPEALRRLLPDLLLNNYEFVTVSELIHSK